MNLILIPVLIIEILILKYFIKRWRKIQSDFKNYKIVQGKVVDNIYEVRTYSSGGTYTPIIEYLNEKGKTKRWKSDISLAPAIKIGSTLKLRISDDEKNLQFDDFIFRNVGLKIFFIFWSIIIVFTFGLLFPHKTNQFNYSEKTILLQKACINNELQSVKQLIEQGGNVNSHFINGETPLFTICKFNYGNEEMLKLLLNNGAKINETDDEGRTALMIATQYRNINLVKILIERGAKINTLTLNKESVLMHLRTENLSELQKLLINNNLIEIAKLLIYKGAELNIRDKYGITALMYFLDSKQSELAKLLIEKGADLNLKDKYGKTALIYAVNNHQFEIAKLLIEKGSDLNLKDKYGKTALFHAIKDNQTDNVKLLIDKGANLNHKDNDSTTALIYAAERLQIEIVKLLVKHGAKINETDKDGRTALSIFKNKKDEKYKEIIKFLKSKGAKE